MTREQVRQAIATAASQAFRMGQGQSRHHPRAAAEQLAAAVQYAEMLVLPLADMLIEQQVEEATTARLRLALDPEPPADGLGEDGWGSDGWGSPD